MLLGFLLMPAVLAVVVALALVLALGLVLVHLPLMSLISSSLTIMVWALGRSRPGPTAKHPSAIWLSARARAACLIKHIAL